MISSDRFFPTTIMGGHLHIRGIPDWGPWDPWRLEWKDEEFLDMLLNTTVGDRKIRTREGLEAIVTTPTGLTPTRTVWIHERLVNEARCLWEQMVTELR